ncbi:reverse transcriptase domain-containing protein [Tanacetum coccineum]
MSTSSSTQAVSSDVAELKDMVRALILDRKNQTPASAPVKAVEQSCVMLEGGIPIRTVQPLTTTCTMKLSKSMCPGRCGQFQNQANSGYRPPIVSIQNSTSWFSSSFRILMQLIKTISIEEITSIKTEETISHQGQIYRPSGSSPVLLLHGSGTLPGALLPTLRRFKRVSYPKWCYIQGTKAVIMTQRKIERTGSELARTPLNENCSAVILNKLPKKLGDPGRFLIPCEFTGITTCNALADLGASINLMPYYVWNNLSLPELTPTCMTLELADRSITKPIDVYEGEITLRVGKEAITFNLDQTSKYTADYNHMTVNKIDVIDMACDEYSQEVLGFSNMITSGNPTPYSEPIVSIASPTLTPFGDKAILNSEPPPPLPNHEQYMPEVRKELKICEAKTVEPSINEPPEVELKELPPHLEYAFLEGDDKLPVIIAKDLKDEEKAALLKVLKSHKRAIAWKLSDIKGG